MDSNPYWLTQSQQHLVYYVYACFYLLLLVYMVCSHKLLKIEKILHNF